MFIEHREEKIDDGRGGKRRVTKETMIFPRYHQLDSVRKLIDAARRDTVGKNCLVQHSAGSGKTNGISWLSHRLASLHNDRDEKVYDCVVVITDRQVLDRQLQDAIYQIEHAQGVVKPVDKDSKQLAEALVDGTKIVVTTLQKVPFVPRALLHIAAGGSIEDLGQGDQWEVREETAQWQRRAQKPHDVQNALPTGEGRSRTAARRQTSSLRGHPRKRSVGLRRAGRVALRGARSDRGHDSGPGGSPAERGVRSPARTGDRRARRRPVGPFRTSVLSWRKVLDFDTDFDPDPDSVISRPTPRLTGAR